MSERNDEAVRRWASAPVVKITDFPFLEAHCANPDGCPVCQYTRCQFGRLGGVLDPPQPQCKEAATVRRLRGGWWCEEHARPLR